MFKSRFTIPLSLIFSLLLLPVVMSGCGEHVFNPVAILEPQKAAGNYEVAPHLDLIVFIDDTGSVLPVQSHLQAQVVPFLNRLSEEKWNHHFTVSPLSTFREMDQVTAAKYDGNFGDDWIPAYPGAQKTDPGMISPLHFKTPGQFQINIHPSTRSDGKEPGLYNILNVLQSGMGDSGFLRKSSELVLLIIGNGEDTSHVNYCKHPQSNSFLPCEDLGSPACIATAQDPTGGDSKCGSYRSSLDHFKKELQSFHPNLTFYSMVAQKKTQNCQGSPAAQGRRYIEISQHLRGKSYDLCSTDVESVLKDLSQILQSKKFKFVREYLLLETEPDPETIQVMRYINGDRKNPKLVMQDPVNGWTYEGYQPHVETSHDPVSSLPMSWGKGYAIQLHGEARLTGDDDAGIDFIEAGAHRKK